MTETSVCRYLGLGQYPTGSLEPEVTWIDTLLWIECPDTYRSSLNYVIFEDRVRLECVDTITTYQWLTKVGSS